MDEEKLFLDARKYTAMFGVEIPNEPFWPIPAGETLESFAKKVSDSVSDGVDYLTKEFGSGWNCQGKEYIY